MSTRYPGTVVPEPSGPSLLGAALAPAVAGLFSKMVGITTSCLSAGWSPPWCIYCRCEIPPVAVFVDVGGSRHEIRFPRPKCECRVQAALAEREARRREAESQPVRLFHAHSGLEPRILSSRLEDLEPVAGMDRALTHAREFLAAWPQSRPLVLMGYRGGSVDGTGPGAIPCYGNGKTHLALGIRTAVESRGHKAIAVSAPHLLHLLPAIWRSSRQDHPDSPLPSETWLLQHLIRSDLVVVDDLGAEHGDEAVCPRAYKQDFFLRWLGPRLQGGRPFVITTNMSPVQIKAYLGERCFDRLAEKAVFHQMSAESYRTSRRQVR